MAIRERTRLLGAAAMVALLAGCGAAAPRSSTPGQGSTLTTCGVVPSSSGPAASVASVSLTAATTGKAGSSLDIAGRFRARVNAGSLVVGPSTTDVLVVQGDRVVGRDDGPRPELAAILPIRAGRDQALSWLPSTFTLAGCPTGSSASPAVGSGARSSLPPGKYGLILAMGYTMLADQRVTGGPAVANSADAATTGASADPATTGRYLLVSEPVPVTVTG